MGEVIIKIPENVKKVYEFDSIHQLEKLLAILEKRKTKKAFSELLSYKGMLKDDEITQEELHLQGDT